MERHPGGTAETRRLLELAGLAPCRILDMGAGDGDTVRLLRSLGYDAVGIDRAPGADVEQGNFFRCPYPDGSFDAVLSQCAFYVSGDAPRALREAARLLRTGGMLLCSDVCFAGEGAWSRALEAEGFRVRALEDATPAWRAYYIECIWNGTADALCGCVPKSKCSYYLTACERMCVHGFV